jgi:AIPR protein
MNEIEQYRTDLLEDVKATAVQGEFTHEAFVELMARKLVEGEELSDFTPCYYRDKGYRRRDLAIDGFLLDDLDVDATATLIVAEFQGDAKMGSITASQLSSICDSALYFAEDSIEGRLQELEPSKRYSDLADWLYKNSTKIASIRIYVLTDNLLSARAKELPSKSMGKIRVDIHVWDVGRFFRSEALGGREPIEIDLTEFVPGGIPVLRASQMDADYDAFLSAVPATVLADLYDRYGSRLLEGNVRSFLSVRGGVNKGIRSTIIGEPTRFFAYNNGVAATATSADVILTRGVERVTRLRDFQIVNGGQTTASLFTARRKEGADLSRIFVQVKLSVVTPEQAGELIPQISRFANSQNKVSDADFFANHPFHRRLEEISRRLWAPPSPGASYQTKWFYERARGQYLNEQVKLSVAKKKTFQLQHPKTQLITKTDLAKYHNSWARLPDVVSLGAQKNFVRFAEGIAPEWEASDEGFNERWFKQAVGKAILFGATERIVSAQHWYQGGYRANIVTYTIALLSHLVGVVNKKFLDFELFWKQQALPAALEPFIETLSKEVFDVLVSPPGDFANVTEWCKKEACWKRVREHHFQLPRELAPFLSNVEEEVSKRIEAKKGQSLDTKIERLRYIMEKRGQEYWARALEWNGSRNLLPEKEKSILSLIVRKRGTVPTDAQAVVVIGAEKLLQDEGFR